MPTRERVRRAAASVVGPGSLALLGLGGLSACHGGDAGSTVTGDLMPPTSTSSGSTTSSGTSAASNSAGGSSTTSTATTSSEVSAASNSEGMTTLVHDVGWDKDVGDSTPPGCQGKIDFLFVISESGTLKEEQGDYAEALPGFIKTIETKFDDFDFHIMVVGTDEQWGIEGCTALCEIGCEFGEQCCPLEDPDKDGQPCCGAEDYPCALLDLVSACDETMGAGVVFPAGGYASNEPCKIAGGHRYMIKEQPNLAEAFTCAAKVGTSGDNRLGDALVRAISPSLNGPGGCNEGFLRDDALLVITMLAPGSDDSQTIVYPWEWYDAVVEAKHGDPGSVIALSLSNEKCPKFFDTPCEFVKMFPHHVIGDNDGPFAPVFDEATDLVEVACEAFIPQ